MVVAGNMVMEEACLGMRGTLVINAIITLGLVFSIGCMKHVDRLETFHITGKVVEKKNEMPIEGVEIFFRDRGLDYVRSKDLSKGTFKIGETNKDGCFDLSFQYWWGYKEAFFKERPKQKFDLIFSRFGFKDKHMSYDFELLLKKGEIVDVKVDKIILEGK